MDAAFADHIIKKFSLKPGQYHVIDDRELVVLTEDKTLYRIIFTGFEQMTDEALEEFIKQTLLGPDIPTYLPRKE